MASMAGRMAWIREYKEGDGDTKLPKGCYNHPAVILSSCPLNDQVVILTVTSFNNTELADKHPNSREIRANYLPIHPASHPDKTDVLRLRGGMKPHKISYVNIKTKHTVNSDILGSYGPKDSKDIYLEDESYQKLIKLAGFNAVAAQPPLSTAAPAQELTVAAQPPSTPVPPRTPARGRPVAAQPPPSTPARGPTTPAAPSPPEAGPSIITTHKRKAKKAPHRRPDPPDAAKPVAQAQPEPEPEPPRLSPPMPALQLAGIREPRSGTIDTGYRNPSPMASESLGLPHPVPSRSQSASSSSHHTGSPFGTFCSYFCSAVKSSVRVVIGAVSLSVQVFKWCARQGFWLVKLILKGLWYGMGWLLETLWWIGKGVAGGFWR